MYRCYNFLQRLNNIIPPPPTLFWNRSLRKWELKKNKVHVISYYAIVVCCGKIGAIVLSITNFIVGLFKPGVYSSASAMTGQLLLITSFTTALFYDMLVTFYGSDIIALINATRLELDSQTWKFDCDNQNKCGEHYRRKSTKIAAKLFPTRSELAEGITLQVTVLAFTCFLVLCSLFLALVGWDPVYLSLKPFAPEVILASPYFTVFRHVITQIFGQWAVSCPRTVAVVILSTGLNVVKLVKFMVRPRMSYKTILLYKHLIIFLNVAWPILKKISAAFLTLAFFVLVCGSNTLFAGIKRGNIMMVALSVILLFACFVSIQVSFHIAVNMHITTGKLLHSWKETASRHSNRMKWTKIVVGLPQLAIPAGNVGIIDKEIKKNYFIAVLEYSINLLLTLESPSNLIIY